MRKKEGKIFYFASHVPILNQHDLIIETNINKYNSLTENNIKRDIKPQKTLKDFIVVFFCYVF